MGGGSSQVEQQTIPPPQNTQSNRLNGQVQFQQVQKQNTSIKKEAKVQKNGKRKQKGAQDQSLNKNDQNQEQKEQKPKLQLFKTVPKCISKKPSSHVCLSKKCQQYPFFCLDCGGNCEEIHHHNDRSKSVSLKQFEKRIQGRRNRGQQLKQTLQNYESALEELQATFANFYKHEYQILSQIEQSNTPSQKALMLKTKIQNGAKSGLDGKLMLQLWNEQRYNHKNNQGYVQFLQYLTQKQEFLVNMYECFVNVNTITSEIQKQKKQNSNNPSKKQMKQPKQAQQRQKNQQKHKENGQKAYHFFKRYQYDISKHTFSKQHAWNSRIKPLI